MAAIRARGLRPWLGRQAYAAAARPRPRLLCLLCLLCAGAVQLHGHYHIKVEQAQPNLLPQPLRQRVQQPGGRAGHAVALQNGEQERTGTCSIVALDQA